MVEIKTEDDEPVKRKKIPIKKSAKRTKFADDDQDAD